MEDLWAFNEEVVARALFACRTPVVSAVGHETDVTIADLVADVRAATPSQAGELVAPLREELLERLAVGGRRLARTLRVRLDRSWQRLESLAERPVLREHTGLLAGRRLALEHLATRLRARSPGATLAAQRQRLQVLGERGARALAVRLSTAQGRLATLDRALSALSPLRVLERGYSLAYAEGGALVRRGDDLAPGDRLRTRLADGAEVFSRVESVAAPASRAPDLRQVPTESDA